MKSPIHRNIKTHSRDNRSQPTPQAQHAYAKKSSFLKTFALAWIAFFSTALFASAHCFSAPVLADSKLSTALAPLVDDFKDQAVNSLGLPRQYFSDTMAGGGTTIDQTHTGTSVALSGNIAPPRGQLGWASMVLPLDPKGLAQDASAFKGVRITIKIDQGAATISANSTEVTNFDYHSAPLMATADGQFHVLNIPFTSMKRAWSEQTTLKANTLASLSISAYALKAEPFALEVKDVSFY